MAVYTFTLQLEGPDIVNDAMLDRLFEAGCDDASFGSSEGRQYANFAREAPSFGAAVGSAIQQVETAVPGLTVVRVEREELALEAASA